MDIWQQLSVEKPMILFSKNKEQQEVDFIIADENRPLLLIETKLSETQPSKTLVKFQSTLNVPAVQLTNKSGGYRLFSTGSQKILISSAWKWLSTLP